MRHSRPQLSSTASLAWASCCAAFALAHLSSNRNLQVQLVERGALKPRVSMMAVQAEPRHYAGLALLKALTPRVALLRVVRGGRPGEDADAARRGVGLRQIVIQVSRTQKPSMSGSMFSASPNSTKR